MVKKKILLLSDDLRMSSGVGTMSREFVMGTLQHYDWVQVGGAIKHPDAGKIIDMNDAVRKETGIEDAYLKIYPVSGYGSPEMIRQIIKMENTVRAVRLAQEKTLYNFNLTGVFEDAYSKNEKGRSEGFSGRF